MVNMKIHVLGLLHMMVGLSFQRVQHGHVCESLGGEHWNGRCFIFSNSYNTSYDQMLTWDGAQQYCVNTYAGQLATFDDPHAFWEYVSKRAENGPNFRWVGGRKTTKEGPWKWLDGKTFVPSPPGYYLNDVGCLMVNREDYTGKPCDCSPCYGHICEVWL